MQIEENAPANEVRVASLSRLPARHWAILPVMLIGYDDRKDGLCFQIIIIEFYDP
jgi:hypothetical protein